MFLLIRELIFETLTLISLLGKLCQVTIFSLSKKAIIRNNIKICRVRAQAAFVVVVVVEVGGGAAAGRGGGEELQEVQ